MNQLCSELFLCATFRHLDVTIRKTIVSTRAFLCDSGLYNDLRRHYAVRFIVMLRNPIAAALSVRPLSCHQRSMQHVFSQRVPILVVIDVPSVGTAGHGKTPSRIQRGEHCVYSFPKHCRPQQAAGGSAPVWRSLQYKRVLEYLSRYGIP